MHIHVNSFVKRQTVSSRFTHFEGSWKSLVKLVVEAVDSGHIRSGYREGVKLVDVDPTLFRSGLVILEPGMRLEGRYEARRDGETPRKSTSVVGASKSPAKRAFVVLYASTVLAEDGDNEQEAVEGNWEIISLNSSPTEEDDIPIAPGTLMHNHFGSDGGTDTHMTNDEFVSQLKISFEYWKNKAFVLDLDQE